MDIPIIIQVILIGGLLFATWGIIDTLIAIVKEDEYPIHGYFGKNYQWEENIFFQALWFVPLMCKIIYVGFGALFLISYLIDYLIDIIK